MQLLAGSMCRMLQQCNIILQHCGSIVQPWMVKLVQHCSLHSLSFPHHALNATIDDLLPASAHLLVIEAGERKSSAGENPFLLKPGS